MITKEIMQMNAFSQQITKHYTNTTRIQLLPGRFPRNVRAKVGNKAPQNYVVWFIKACAHIYVQPRALNAFPANEKTCQINDP